MMIGSKFITRNTIHLNKSNNHRTSLDLICHGTRIKAIFGQLSPLCLWHHRHTIGHLKFLVVMVAPTGEDSKISHMLNLLSSFKLGRKKEPNAATYPSEGTSHLLIYHQLQRESLSKSLSTLDQCDSAAVRR